MRFVLMTDKTPNQCMRALHERLQAGGTKSRPDLDGWIEKNGHFSISVSTPVFGKFTRSTRLRATAERESGVTVIRGFVPDGVSREWLGVIGVGIVGMTLYMLASGQLIPALLILLAGGALVIPLWGDHLNHDVLLYELEKTLKAKPATPSSKSSDKKSASKAKSGRR